MAGLLQGKVAIVTGSGRGIGRAEALALAREGAKVVVNDLPGPENPADAVVREIKKLGSDAAPNYDNVTSFNGAKNIIDTATSKFGKLDILVNNAGILRDKMLFNMTEEEWDIVIAVHLKGTFNCTRHACVYFRDEHKAGKLKSARIINTSSDAGLSGNPGQLNYGAAKAGIAAMTIITSKEMSKYNVTCNCIAPLARTALTLSSPMTAQMMGQQAPKEGFDIYDPENVAPLVAYLASDQAQNINGRVFHIFGGTVELFKGWSTVKKIEKQGRWTSQELVTKMNDLFK